MTKPMTRDQIQASRGKALANAIYNTMSLYPPEVWQTRMMDILKAYWQRVEPENMPLEDPEPPESDLKRK
jgi:hypothetical protein